MLHVSLILNCDLITLKIGLYRARFGNITYFFISLSITESNLLPSRVQKVTHWNNFEKALFVRVWSEKVRGNREKFDVTEMAGMQYIYRNSSSSRERKCVWYVWNTIDINNLFPFFGNLIKSRSLIYDTI